MKLDDIIALSNAGWTKEDILKLAGDTFTVPAVQEEAPAEDAAEKPVKEQVPENKPDKLDEVIGKLEKISSGMQAMALQNTRMPERESVDDILSQILNPKKE